MVRHAPISKYEFAAWLEQRGKGPVGWSGSFDDCPLARAVIHKGEYAPGAFHGTSAVLYKPFRKMKYEWIYPQWARDFVTALDKQECVVTAEEALFCLRLSGAGGADEPKVAVPLEV